MAPYSATSRELSGAAKASLRLGLGHPLYAPPACSLLPPPSVRLLSTEAIAYLITISSSSIDSLCDSCSACLLPTVHLGNTALHIHYVYQALLPLNLFRHSITRLYTAELFLNQLEANLAKFENFKLYISPCKLGNDINLGDIYGIFKLFFTNKLLNKLVNFTN